jgi:Uncharacterized protein conserved in bacteria (DUF2219)
VVKQHRVPKGWPHQVRTMPGINAMYTVHRRFAGGPFDLQPGLGVAAGTVQTFGMGEATLRFGKGLSGFAPGVATSTKLGDGRTMKQPAPRRAKWELGLFGAAQWRYFVRNLYLDGAFGTGEPEVSKVRSVNDLRVGAFLRYKQWRVTYTGVGRSREFEGEVFEEDRTRHYYGSIAVTRELPAAWGTGQCPCFLERNWMFEIGMGRGHSVFDPRPPRGDGFGLAGRVAAAKGLTTFPFERQTHRRRAGG